MYRHWGSLPQDLFLVAVHRKTLIKLGFKKQKPNDFYYDYTPLNPLLIEGKNATSPLYQEGPGVCYYLIMIHTT